MRHRITLTATSVLSVLLFSLHWADEIARGMEPGTLSAAGGLLILFIWLYAALVLADRRWGLVVLLLFSLMGAAVPVLDMGGADSSAVTSPTPAGSSSGPVRSSRSAPPRRCRSPFRPARCGRFGGAVRLAPSGGSVLADLFPRVADNHYLGHRLGLWLFALMPLKIAMGLNVMLNAPSVALSADGVPVQTFGEAAGPAFLFMFAAWGLCQLVLGLCCLVVLLRYRSLVPLAFLALLLEQAGRRLLQLSWPIERIGTPPGGAINAVILGILVVGLVLSVWRGRGVVPRA